MAVRTREVSKPEDPPRSVGASTRDRILEASRMLFNRNGVQGTAIFGIAAHLSISPGNLTYHFKSKSDIVRALAVDLEQHIASVLKSLTSPVRPPEVVASMEEILQTMWSARFFFNSALSVSRMDADLAEKFQQVHGNLCHVIRDYLELLISRREMKPPRAPYGAEFLSDNIVAVWQQWLRLQGIDTPDAIQAGKSAIQNCLRHHFTLMAPYMSRGFTDAIWEEVDRHCAA